MKPGDIVYCPDANGVCHRFYMIEGVFLGSLNQQSLIELRSMTEASGTAYGKDMPASVFVPEPLLRHFTIYTPDIKP